MANIVEYLVQLYFAQIYASVKNKMYSKSLSLALTIASMQEDTGELKRLNWIYENTTQNMKIPLPILEDLMEKSYIRTPKMKVYSIFGKEIKFHEIIKALSDAYIEITISVTRIAKELNVDIPFDMSAYQQQQ